VVHLGLDHVKHENANKENLRNREPEPEEQRAGTGGTENPDAFVQLNIEYD
jgi:hypothetical protein